MGCLEDEVVMVVVMETAEGLVATDLMLDINLVDMGMALGDRRSGK
jgi:hypothetical protein